jgi:hypothetical protein
MIWYRRAVLAFSAVFVVLGVVILFRTAAAGGGVTGYVVGGLFIALGVARVTLARAASKRPL